MSNIVIDWIGGNCPVQAEGTIDGQPFYFRARGEHWSLSIGGDNVVGDPAWYYEEEYPGGPFAAGWMSEAEARKFLEEAAARYSAQPPAKCPVCSGAGIIYDCEEGCDECRRPCYECQPAQPPAHHQVTKDTEGQSDLKADANAAGGATVASQHHSQGE